MRKAPLLLLLVASIGIATSMTMLPVAASPSGLVKTLGSDSYGQLACGRLFGTSVPMRVTAGVRSVSSSDFSAYFIKEDGTLWRVETELETERFTFIDSGVASVCVGGGHILYLKPDGTLWGYGQNGSGQLGTGTTDRPLTPIQISTDVTTMAAGAVHSFFVKTDGTLWGMGRNAHGQLGLGYDLKDRLTPTLVASGVRSVSTNGTSVSAFTIFVKTDGTAWATGNNPEGQFGNGTTESRATPVQVASGVRAVGTGPTHTLFLKEDGSTWGTGANFDGQLGVSSWTRQLSPVEIQVPPEISRDIGEVSADGDSTLAHTLFLTRSGTLWAAGSNAYGQLGDGTLQERALPVLIATNVRSAAAGTYHSMFVTTDGVLWSMGRNDAGILGDGSRPSRAIPVPVFSDATDIEAGGATTFFIRPDGALWSAGDNASGTLGDGTTTMRTRPIRTATNVVSMGEHGGLFIKSDGSLWGMGGNSWGQLGISSTFNRVTPTQVWTDVAAVATSGAHSLVIKTDQTLWSMGYNFFGQLGQGTSGSNAGVFTPAQIAGDVASASANGYHSHFIKRDGTLWGAGSNSFGQLGDGTRIDRPLPVSVASDVARVAAGGSHCLYIKSDGTLWAMGANEHGQLGDGSRANRSAPIQIAAGVTAAAAGTNHSLFLKSDGTVWGMGANQYGQVGLGGPDDRLSPAQFASGIASIAAGNDHTVLLSIAPEAPTILRHPSSASIVGEANVTFSIEAVGQPGPSYTWQSSQDSGQTWTNLTEGAACIGTATESLELKPARPALNGTLFRCVAANATGTVASAAAELRIKAPPVIATQPVAQTVTRGTSVELSVTASAPTGTTLTYQWQLDGEDIFGATESTYRVPSAQTFHAGAYRCVVTADGISVTTDAVTLALHAYQDSDARLQNLSTRALCQTGDDVLIPGFYIGGTGTKRLLMRAAGPELLPFGVTNALPDPQMVLKRQSDGSVIASNDNWGDNDNWQDIRDAATALRAFRLDIGSRSAALLLDLPAGGYSIVSSGHGSETGVAIVELYDISGPSNATRLINISNRGFVGFGGNIMIPGFVVSPEGSRTFLIRAVGPTLATYHVTGTLDDPVLQVFSGDTCILTNDNWSSSRDAATTANTAKTVSAFPLAVNSKDAAFVVTLPPGSYTIQATGKNNTTGVALVEIYLVP